ncbi:MAG: CPBP family intramembrane metalloprotease [Chloroflexi bacterium]|nr:CPBP family intramembrane metalloprotease [Chloroflexota bacterium]
MRWRRRLVAGTLSAGGLVAVAAGLAASREVVTPLLFGAGMLAIALGTGLVAGSQARRRRAEGTAAYLGPSPVLVFAVAVAAGLGAQALVLAGGPDLPDAIALIVSSGTMAGSALVAVAVLVVRPGALGWREMGLGRSATAPGQVLRDAAWGAVLAGPTLLLAGLVAAVLVALLGVAPGPVLPLGPDPAVRMASLVVAVVVAPAWEELFFRGFASTAWAMALGTRAAIVRGAIFFALIHVLTAPGGDPGAAARIALIAFTVRLPVGLVLGWAFFRRRSLVAPIALHATYNALPILLVMATPSALPGS